MAWPPNFKIYDRKTHFSAGSGGKGRSDKVETSDVPARLGLKAAAKAWL